jgi:hypothetical protein
MLRSFEKIYEIKYLLDYTFIFKYKSSHEIMCEVHKPEKNRVLYEDSKITIECDPREIDGHIIRIGENHHIFPRRCLDDLYKRSSAGSLYESLRALDPTIGNSLQEAEISVECLGWALAKAKARDLENQLYSR